MVNTPRSLVRNSYAYAAFALPLLAVVGFATSLDLTPSLLVAAVVSGWSTAWSG